MSAKIRPKDLWKIEPAKTALVVIDMQQAFVGEGAILECCGAREMVPKINELARICRRLGIPVFQIRSMYRADLSDMGLARDFKPAEVDSEYFCVAGRKGAEFFPELEIAESDYIVNKIRYSAFIAGASHLELLLRGLGRDSFIACGGATEGCVANTIRDAHMLGFKVFCVRDLTAARNEEWGRMALAHLDYNYAKVMTFEEVQKELEQIEATQEIGSGKSGKGH